MSNMLDPGSAGLPAPSPNDQSAVPPGGGLAMAAPGPSPMAQHFGSAEDAAEAQWNKASEASGQVAALRRSLDKLAAFGDTVTMDDLVEAAGDMVAAGIPAIQVASSLAEAPEQPAQLQAWVQEKLQQLAPKEEQMRQVKAEAGYGLAQASMTSLIAHSAEAHFNREAPNAR